MVIYLYTINEIKLRVDRFLELKIIEYLLLITLCFEHLDEALNLLFKGLMLGWVASGAALRQETIWFQIQSQ